MSTVKCMYSGIEFESDNQRIAQHPYIAELRKRAWQESRDKYKKVMIEIGNLKGEKISDIYEYMSRLERSVGNTPKTGTINGLLQQSIDHDNKCSDHLVGVQKLSYQYGNLLFDGISMKLTETGLTQLSANLGIPAKFIKRCPSWLREENINYFINKRAAEKPDYKFFVRSYQGSDLVARAVLSEHYRPISNRFLLETLSTSLSGVNNVKIIRPYLDRDSLILRVVVVNDVGPENGNYGLGLFIKNNETGQKSLTISPLVMRTSCTNSLSFDKDKSVMNIRHVHHDPKFLIESVKVSINNCLNSAGEKLEYIEIASLSQVDIASTINELSRKYKFTKKEKDLVRIGTENSNSLMGIINGITWMAKSVAPHKSYQYELLAGRMLETGVIA